MREQPRHEVVCKTRLPSTKVGIRADQAEHAADGYVGDDNGFPVGGLEEEGGGAVVL